MVILFDKYLQSIIKKAKAPRKLEFTVKLRMKIYRELHTAKKIHVAIKNRVGR